MRVLLVTGSAPPMKCGVGDYTMQLAKALAARPEISAVCVLASYAAGTPQLENGVQLLPVIKSWRVDGLVAAIRELRRIASDIVHVQYPTQGYGRGYLPALLPLIAGLSGKRVVQTWHEAMSLGSLPRMCLQLIPRSEIVVVRHNFRELLPSIGRLLLKHKRLHYIAGAAALPKASLTRDQREAHRRTLLHGQSRLVVYLGFIYEHKGVDLLFDVADPAVDHLVIAGQFGPDAAYRRRVERLATGRWAGKVTFPGFLPAEEAAVLLAVADAVVLPFRNGGGDWNSSLLAAVANGAFVVTTSSKQRGYDAERGIEFVAVDDVDAMRLALSSSSVRRCDDREAAPTPRWEDIAAQHVAIYEGITRAPSPVD